MIKSWNQRSTITANLLNPAFCGEVIRRAAVGYNNYDDKTMMPFVFSFLILPIVLHKKTRENMPRSIASYFHTWVEENEHLFVDFPERVRQMAPYSREAISFLMIHEAISVNESGLIEIARYRKINPTGSDTVEITEIYRKSEMLGKWLRLNGSPQTVFMFLKIRP